MLSPVPDYGGSETMWFLKLWRFVGDKREGDNLKLLKAEDKQGHARIMVEGEG